MKKGSQRGQTLLELIISIGVVVFVMLGLVVAVTSSLRFSQASRNRSRAVKYAQEAIEITRQLRDANLWDTFLGYTNMTSKVWCLSKERVWTVEDGNCTPLDGVYTRNVTLTWDDPRVIVNVDVSWQDGSRVLHSRLDTYLTQWK
ncbi:prepilin-type N-terminal cleavage/methylation domain-containing protein [Candidatus Woesebacteria bacterium]|nr:prepilin-type N-terminal cleavage/methylation domain-containing protein [Candidatus Woesebacteria bacterium]